MISLKVIIKKIIHNFDKFDATTNFVNILKFCKSFKKNRDGGSTLLWIIASSLADFSRC